MDVQVWISALYLVLVLLVPGKEVSADDDVCHFQQWHVGGKLICKTPYQLNCARLTGETCDHHDIDIATGCATCCCCQYSCHPSCQNHCQLDKHGCPLPSNNRSPKCTATPIVCSRKEEYCPRNCNSGNQGGYHKDEHGCVTCKCNNDPMGP